MSILCFVVCSLYAQTINKVFRNNIVSSIDIFSDKLLSQYMSNGWVEKDIIL